MYEALLKRIQELEEQVQWLMARQAASDGRQIEPLYTLKETADLIRCHQDTVKLWMRKHTWPKRFVYLGRAKRRVRMLLESEVLTLLKERGPKYSDWTMPRRSANSSWPEVGNAVNDLRAEYAQPPLARAA